MASLNVKGLQQVFGDVSVLTEVNLALASGQTLAILGASGSGKTTLLRLIAGQTPLQAGEIYLDGQALSSLNQRERRIFYLSQEALLFPHLSAFENIAFGLRVRKEKTAFVRQRTAEMLKKLDLVEQAHQLPQALSGGQKQRVAFGRALMVEPRLLLLDEPFAALDNETRARMQQLFREVVQQAGVSSILVTHDQKEALLLGNEFAFLEKGRLHHFPNRNAFVADTRTGVQAELAFWNRLKIENNDKL